MIAAQQLAPPVALAWAMLILGPLLAFLHFGTWPTIVSLGPLLTGFVLSAGFGIIGFGVGNLLPHRRRPTDGARRVHPGELVLGFRDMVAAPRVGTFR